MVKKETYQIATATSKCADASREFFMQLPFAGTYTMTQKFGENPNYYKNFGLAGHDGLDWACPEGTAVLAVESGHIIRRNSGRDYGKVVIVWHHVHNLATWYCHLKSASVIGGEYVEKGQQIGLSNNTGSTNGTHLHLGLCETDEKGERVHIDNGYGGFIDPAPYVETKVTFKSQQISDTLVYEGKSSRNVQKHRSLRSHVE